MSKFEIPEIPHELVLKARLKQAAVWDLADLDLADPVVTISWDGSAVNGVLPADPRRMVEDREYDLAVQLQNVRRKIEMLEAGSTGPNSIPTLNLLHFGTGPVATAFGATMVMREGSQPHFHPAVHTAEEVLRMDMPDLRRGGWLGAIIDRIEFFNDATQGKIPITISDNAGPWCIASSIWHYEDMIEGILTCPEAVHHLLGLCTRAIIEVDERQIETARNAWGVIGDAPGLSCFPRGAGLADDVMVTVSTAMWREFFKPYNEIISRRYGGIIYHCCMEHERHLQGMSETAGFMGYDADPGYNSMDVIEKTLTGKGVWNRVVSDAATARRCRGKFGFFLGAHGHTKENAVENARRLLDAVHA